MIADDLGAIGRVWPLANHPKLPRTRETVAIHEAGHAVVALALGLPCHAIRIEGEGEATTGGFAMSAAADLDAIHAPDIHRALEADQHASLVRMLARVQRIPPKQAALDFATMSAAGRQAEIVAAELPWPGVLWSYDRDGLDTRAYLAVSYRLPMGLGYVQRRAHALLSHEWLRVQQIATHVIEHGAWSSGNA